MACPQCRSDEISEAGVCLICGYQIQPDRPKPSAREDEADSPGHSGTMEMIHPGGATLDTPEKNEVPPWRQQLSQRLHEIKQKKEAMAAQPREIKPAVPPVSQAKTAETLSSLQERLKKVPVRRPPAPIVPPPQQKTLRPLPPEPVPKAAVPTPAPDSQQIRNLIDSAIQRQTAPAAEHPVVVSGPISEHEAVVDREGKLILLSRTLSGLVDLIVVLLCTGLFVVAVDYFSGIVALDRVSVMLFSLVFLMNFLLYSMFFLSTANQTIGMMITDLRVVSADEKRPSIGELLRRCIGFLLSLFCAGIGLLSSLFDKESLCFHDRISNTQVIRL